MDFLGQEFRHAARSLAKSGGFTVLAILTIVLGAFGTVEIFSVVNAVILRPLPFPDSDKLVEVAELRDVHGSTAVSAVSYPNFLDWRARNHVFSNIASYRDADATLTGSAEPEQIPIAIVSADFFRVLGVEPVLGRGFLPEEEKQDSAVVILSNSFWRATFGSDIHVVDRTITLDHQKFTIVGIMPAGFDFPYPAPSLWTTAARDAGTRLFTLREAHIVHAIARLRPEISILRARQEMNSLATQLAQEHPDTNANSTKVQLIPEQDRLTVNVKAGLLILLGAVAAVLLIACVNIANLFLGRIAGREREFAIRAALGAARWQISCQWLIECALLAVCGTGIAVLLAFFFSKYVPDLYPEYIPRLDKVSVDKHVLVFAAALAVGIVVLSGIAPTISVLRGKFAVNESGARSIAGGIRQRRLSRVLIVAELTASIVLLVCAGLLLRSFAGLLQTDLGFNPHSVLTLRFNFPDTYASNQQIRFYDSLLLRIRSSSGVVSAAGGIPLPLSGDRLGTSVEIQGHPLPKSEQATANLGVVTPEFFRTLNIPLLNGRDFSETDTSDSPATVIINDAFARRYFPSENPVGKYIKPQFSVSAETPWRQIVGIVGNIRRRDIKVAANPEFYVPYSQGLFTSMSIVVRTAGKPSSIANSVRGQIAGLDPELAIYDVAPLEKYINDSLASPRFHALLISAFAGLALMLSAVGLYGVMNQAMLQRKPEVAVRMALGADRSRILRMILLDGLKLTVVGLVIGILTAIGAARLISSALYAVKPLDLLTFCGVVGILLATSLVSCFAPAYRASGLEPSATLHEG